MNREVCKFLSGFFGALGWAHAGYAMATSAGLVSEPTFLGRRWGVGYMWTEAAVYTAIGAGLGYLGWFAAAEEALPQPADELTRTA
ncbi:MULTISPECIES: hypothetical protein [unclassified Mycobacterium]|uniref:hypothetical protein n=1 Tax=unclassified Mycobacterium TaxID=2642494 RepID=UPI002741B91B|nr:MULTISPECIES: hypothetical protein [unclassified Mycobacterium]MDP7701444.1 hypothetical protein [Mycobacterium sp. TY815]MDP7724289.1 hypothetical protein [Mycobacterium sp. TY814]